MCKREVFLVNLERRSTAFPQNSRAYRSGTCPISACPTEIFRRCILSWTSTANTNCCSGFGASSQTHSTHHHHTTTPPPHHTAPWPNAAQKREPMRAQTTRRPPPPSMAMPTRATPRAWSSASAPARSAPASASWPLMCDGSWSRAQHRASGSARPTGYATM